MNAKGARLKRRHKEFLSAVGMNYQNWRVKKDTPTEIHFIHKISGQTRIWHKDNFTKEVL